jgi:hypothetical protein
MATRLVPHALDIEAEIVSIRKQLAEIDKLRVDTRFVPWHFLVGGITAGATLVGGTAAVVKIFF